MGLIAHTQFGGGFMHLSELAVRLIGPFIFSAAFIVFIMNYNTVDDYMQLIKSKFTDGEVYRQDVSLDGDENEYFKIQDEMYSVSGDYLVGYLNGDITTKVIIDNDNDNTLTYKRLVIDPNGLEYGARYDLYSQQLAQGSVNQYVIAESGKWIPGESVNLNSVISLQGSYLFTPQYADTGVLSSITFTLE